MKKLIAVAAVLVASVFTANSQDTKMWIGGAASFGSQKTDQDGAKPVTNGVFSPGFGYNINETITAGLFLNISGGKSTDETGAEVKSSSFAVDPFVRYNKAAGDKFTMFGQLDINIGSEKMSYDGTSNKGTSFFGIGIAPGVDYAFTPAFSITATVGALRYTSANDKDSEVKTNSFDFGLDLNAVSFGLFYHFGK